MMRRIFISLLAMTAVNGYLVAQLSNFTIDRELILRSWPTSTNENEIYQAEDVDLEKIECTKNRKTGAINCYWIGVNETGKPAREKISAANFQILKDAAQKPTKPKRLHLPDAAG